MNSAASTRPVRPVQPVNPAPDWRPDSWQGFNALQQATYPDAAALTAALARLADLPPLVTSWEVENLREQIAMAQQGKAFLLQGGDCAESFDDCQSDAIAKKLKILLQIHDELVLEVPEREVEETSRELRQSMESVLRLRVPLEVNISVGENLAEV